ncbi:MAG: hypothetical protein Q4F99_07400, partial [bacterium]|nr:hypothetical protein [bacterium]
MKLIEKHTPCKLSENNIYTEFQCLFHSVFCDIPDIDLDNASFYNEHFCYQESELEKKNLRRTILEFSSYHCTFKGCKWI